MRKYWALILAAAVLAAGYFCFYRRAALPVSVSFEFAGRLEKKKAMRWDNWFIVNDRQKRSEIDSDVLAEFCDIKNFEMDFDMYTYLFVDGYELMELSYRPDDCRRRFSASPDYCGYAVLKKADDQLYAYRIPSDLRIIKDPHAHYESDYRTTLLD